MTLAAYVHLPYCASRCPYCDFNAYAVRNVPDERYTDGLVRELTWLAATEPWQGRRIGSVFFGGGTPSLFSPASIGRVLAEMDRRLGLAGDVEVTLEANPGSLEGGGAERLASFRSAGINRLSFGVQSFDDRTLATLGRLHDGDAALAAIDGARTAGFTNLSCDLIFAVPGQSPDDWQRDLDTLAAAGPEHASLYNLTYEQGTPMTGLRDAGRLVAADEDTELDMMDRAEATLTGCGLERYEISNFARPGFRSRHNGSYWRGDDVLALGAGAHGYTATGGPWGKRYRNVRLPESYLSAPAGAWVESWDPLDRDKALAEFVLLRMRLAEGFAEDDLRSRFGGGCDELLPRTSELARAGLVRRDDDRVRLTRDGLRVADTVIATMVP